MAQLTVDPVPGSSRGVADETAPPVEAVSTTSVGSIGTVDSGKVCPYLVDAAGPWRRAEPARSHRCRAVSPAAPIPGSTQRRICLSGSHATCEAYEAATLDRAASLSADHIRAERLEASRFGSIVRPLPLAVSPARALSASSRPSADLLRPMRRRPRAALAGGAIALVVVGVIGNSLWPAPAAMTAGDAPAPFRASASPRASASLDTQVPSTAPPSTPTRTAPAAPVATPPPASPVLPAGRRYVVMEGDRLRAIARRFETTVSAIIAANDLNDRPPRIAPGQTLIIPSS